MRLCGTAHGSSAPRDRSACLFRGRSTADLPYGTAGSAPALSRARRKTSGKEEKIKIDRPHSSLPGLELARGSIAYGPEVRAGGKAGANDCGAVDGVELANGSSGPVSSTRTVENLVYSAASRSSSSEKTCGVIAAEVREKRMSALKRSRTSSK